MSYIGSRPANKPVTINDITDDAISLSKMAGGTDGNIISYDASGNPVSIATGNDGMVLTSTGAGSPPAFEALPSSGVSLSGSTNNQLTTVTGANAIAGEAQLLFDGTNLTVGSAGAGLGKLAISTADSGASAHADADELVMENAGASGLSILSFNNNYGNLYFGDGQDNDIGKVTYLHTDNSMSFTTNATIGLKIDSTGAVTKPLQPGFSATKSTSAQAVNAAYVSVNFNNEIWDNNGDWNGSTTFTAPVTGKYMFTGAMRIDSILAQGGSVFGRINTSNRPYVFGNITDADDVFNATVAAYQFQGAVVADMDANDTATLDFFSNFATTIAADAERVWFQGYLLG